LKLFYEQHISKGVEFEIKCVWKVHISWESEQLERASLEGHWHGNV